MNVASTAGLRGYAGVSAYAASKHGVVGLTRSAAAEIPTSRKRSIVISRAFAAVTFWCSKMASLIWLPIVCTGEKELIGS